MKTCIIGYEYIGQATHKMLGHVDYIFGSELTEPDIKEIKQTNIAFICLEDTCDFEALNRVLKDLTDNCYNGVICIRSRVPKELLQKKYLVFVPNFLPLNGHLKLNYVQLIGGNYENSRVIAKLFDMRHVKYKMTSAENAYHVKLAFDLRKALDSLLWSIIQDITSNSFEIYQTLKSLNTSLDADFSTIGGKTLEELVSIAPEHPILKALTEIIKHGKNTED